MPRSGTDSRRHTHTPLPRTHTGTDRQWDTPIGKQNIQFIKSTHVGIEVRLHAPNTHTPNHAAVPLHDTHTHTSTDKLRRRWLRCRRRFRRLAMTRGGQSRQWRQFHAKRTLINLLHTRVAPPSPVPDTCCAPVCMYVCECANVNVSAWVP